MRSGKSESRTLTSVNSPFSKKKFEFSFEPSKYLDSEKSLWKLIYILGESKFSEELNESDGNVNEDFIENSFDHSTIAFYIDKKNRIIFSALLPAIKDKYGNLPEISLHDSLKYLNVDDIENLLEKSQISY